MLETISATDGRTILDAPDNLLQLKGFLLAHEHEAEQGSFDTSGFRAMRASLDYAINLTREARRHYAPKRD